MTRVSGAIRAVRRFNAECLMVMDGLNGLALRHPWLCTPVAIVGLAATFAAFVLVTPALWLVVGGAWALDRATRP